METLICLWKQALFFQTEIVLVNKNLFRKTIVFHTYPKVFVSVKRNFRFRECKNTKNTGETRKLCVFVFRSKLCVLPNEHFVRSTLRNTRCKITNVSARQNHSAVTKKQRSKVTKTKIFIATKQIILFLKTNFCSQEQLSF